MAVLSEKKEPGSRLARVRVRYRRFARRLRRFPWALAGILFVLSIGLATAGIFYHEVQARQVRAAYEREFGVASSLEAEGPGVPFQESEIFASLRDQGFILIGLVLAFVLSAAGGLILIWYRLRSRLESEHILAEVERLAMAQRYEFLSRYAHDVIFLLDDKLGVVEANDRAGEVYGYSNEEIRALGLNEIRTPGAAAEEERHLALVKKKGGHVFETVHRKKNGAAFPAEMSARVVEAGGKVFYQCVLRDISERKAAEAELKRYREHLEDIVAERTEELRISNERLSREVEVRRLAEQRILRQGRLLRGINRILCEGLSVSTDRDVSRICLEEAMGLTGSAAGFVEEKKTGGGVDFLAGSAPWAGEEINSHSGDEPRLSYLCVQRHVERIQREGKSLAVNEPSRAARGRGTSAPQAAPRSFLGVPLIHDQTVVGVIGLADKAAGYSPEDQADVEALATPLAEVLNRKRSEKTVRLLNAELAGRVAELTAANQELDAFSYSVAHDLRAPLRAMAGFAGILEEEYGPSLGEEGRRQLGIIGGNVRMMNELLDKLLSLSRLSRQPLTCSRIDVGSLTREIFLELKSQAGGRDIDLELGPSPPCRGDRNLMRQVLFNLLSNAFKFTRTRKKAELKFWGETGASEVSYTLQDNGVGFDQLNVHKLFGVFQRLHSPLEFEGTGVGLSIVERIIRRHGGRVRAEGVMDRGAAFSFTLPRDLLAVDEQGKGEDSP